LETVAAGRLNVPSRKAVLSVAFVSLGVTWTTWEVVAAQNPQDDLVPLTTLLVDHVPAPVTLAAVALLVAWLPGHFVEAYANRKAAMSADTTVTVPATPEVGSPKEPLVNVGSITAAVAALLAVLVAFGLDLSDVQTGAVLTLVTVAAPLVVAAVGRRKVFSPATVRTMVVDAADNLQPGETRIEAVEVLVPPPDEPGDLERLIGPDNGFMP
jgi:hypothetical protein